MKQVFYFIRTKRNNLFWYVEKVLSPDNFVFHTCKDENAKRFLDRESAVKFFEEHYIFNNELGFSVVMETREIKSHMHLFNMFALNYPHDFIQKVWGDVGKAMQGHMVTKFHSAYNISGSYGAMTKFWAELDNANREKLENWIVCNYKG